MQIKMLDDEFWYGGAGVAGYRMPLNKDSQIRFDYINGKIPGIGADAEAGFFLSNKGRYIWCDDALDVRFDKGVITVESEHEVAFSDGQGSLRGAYLDAMKKHFPFNGKTPDDLFFTRPQYNTWIELLRDENQADVLKYAHNIVDNGMPTGILMIDGGWQRDFGVYEFDKEIFPDPKAMMDELHALGFKVMLWISPIIASAGKRFRLLKSKDYLVKDKTGQPAVRKWWSGYSCMLDFSNPDACRWFDGEIQNLMALGADGIKMDAGSPIYYRDDDITYGKVTAHGQTRCLCEFTAQYPFNENHGTWNAGGLPVVSRLQDKHHKWEGGIDLLLPDSLTQGILGYAYGCPDMIGGGEETSFYNDAKLDHELFIRWAQASALLPMMQFSAAPWRVLTEEECKLVLSFADLRVQYGDYINRCAKNAAVNGEPIARYMEYQYPNRGYETVVDQFMLGEDMLVAPVLTKGAVSREVYIPDGEWIADDGEHYTGPQKITVDAPLTRLPYFTRKK